MQLSADSVEFSPVQVHIPMRMFIKSNRPGPTFFELAKQVLSSTERGYDLLAPKFDLTSFRTPDWLIESVLARFGEVDAALTSVAELAPESGYSACAVVSR